MAWSAQRMYSVESRMIVVHLVVVFIFAGVTGQVVSHGFSPVVATVSAVPTVRAPFTRLAQPYACRACGGD